MAGKKSKAAAGDMKVPVAKIDLGPNVRRKADPELKKSIALHGLIQPITVARGKGGRFNLVDGSRRLAAYKALKWPTIPVFIVDLSGAAATAASLAANTDRRDLTAIEEAEAIAKMYEEGFSSEDVEARFKKTGDWVTSRLALLSLPKDVREKLHTGAIPIGGALLFLRAPTADVQKNILDELRRGTPLAEIADDLRCDDDAVRALPRLMLDYEKCQTCPRAGRNCPRLFGESDYDKKMDARLCYNPKCFNKTVAEVVAKAEAEGREVVDAGTPEGKRAAREKYVTEGQLCQLSGGDYHFRTPPKPCVECKRTGIVKQTAEFVCLDRDCYNKKYAKAYPGSSRVEQAGKKAKKAAAANKSPFTEAVLFRAREIEDAQMSAAVKAAVANGGQPGKPQQVFNALVAAIARDSAPSGVGMRQVEAFVTRALADPKECQAMMQAGVDRALDADSVGWRYAAAAHLGIIEARVAEYVLTKGVLEKLNLTKAGLLALVKQADIEGKIQASDGLPHMLKRGELAKAVIKHWPKGLLPLPLAKVQAERLAQAGISKKAK